MLATLETIFAVNATIRRLIRLVALAICVHAAAPYAAARSPATTADAETSKTTGQEAAPDAAQAKAKLAAVREHIADLTGRLGAELKQRDSLSARVREADLAITEKRRRLEALDAAEGAAERKRSDLRAEQSRTRAALDSERGCARGASAYRIHARA